MPLYKAFDEYITLHNLDNYATYIHVHSDPLSYTLYTATRYVVSISLTLTTKHRQRVAAIIGVILSVCIYARRSVTTLVIMGRHTPMSVSE